MEQCNATMGKINPEEAFKKLKNTCYIFSYKPHLHKTT